MKSDKNETRYTLSASALLDGEPIRSLCTSNSNTIICGSQGGTVTEFEPPEKITLQPGGETARHPHQVTALSSSPQAINGQNLYASGCRDGSIRVFDGESHGLARVLNGHEKAVTSLSWMVIPSSEGSDASCLLLSGSWDGTCRIWDALTGTCLSVLGGHENTVNVVGLPARNGRGRVATGSAGVASGNAIVDHRLRIWDVTLNSSSGAAMSARAELMDTVSNDHGNAIRGVAYDPSSDKIVTCSNDGTIKIRSALNGESEMTLAHPGGQQPMFISLSVIPGFGYVASTDEGETVIWGTSSEATESQILCHPNTVWQVLALPNGDVATACQDGSVRVFTTDPSRHASAEEIKQLDDAVASSRSKTSSGPTAEEIERLPKWEMNALHQGSSEGKVQVFNKNGKAIAAQWSESSRTWIEVGEVTGQNRNAGTIDGVQYDHVLPIEVDVSGGGVQKLQIGYNNGDNPFVTAQKFIDDYQLDQNYLAQIADYIQSRVAGAGGPSIGSTSASSAPPPSTSSVQTVEMAPPSTPQYQHLPVRGYRSFEKGAEKKSLDKILNKLREFNSTITSNTLSDSELSTLDSLAATLAATSRYHATNISSSELGVITKICRGWDVLNIFPALDLARLTVMHPDASVSTNRSGVWSDLVGLALDKCDEVKGGSGGIEGKGVVPVAMLSLRFFSNCFKGGAASLEGVCSHLKRVLGCAESFALSSNKNIRLSVATLILNITSLMASSSSASAALAAGFDSTAASIQIVTMLGTILNSGLYESEPTVRCLFALGTILYAGDSSVKERAKSLDLALLNNVGSAHGEKAKGVAGEIKLILQ